MRLGNVFPKFPDKSLWLQDKYLNLSTATAIEYGYSNFTIVIHYYGTSPDLFRFATEAEYKLAVDKVEKAWNK